MSKIICDVCGTAYQETANGCPICGSAKQIEGKAAAAGAAAGATRPANRSGHFSNASVRKRNKANQTARRNQRSGGSENPEKNNKGLIIAVCLLLIAVLIVVALIIVKFVVPSFQSGEPNESTLGNIGQSTTVPSDSVIDAATVPCTELTLSAGEITLDAAGRAWLLEVSAEPADHTDTIIFATGDSSVATVNESGRVTAVGPGTTVITVTCGQMTAQCTVTCSFGAGQDTTAPEIAPPTEAETTAAPETTAPPTEPPTEAPTEKPSFGLLEQEDVTLFTKGETFEFETDGVSLEDITWSVDDGRIVTVENGKVTAVVRGTTIVRASYNGRTDSCIVRCEFGGPGPQESEEGGTGSEGGSGSEGDSGSEDHPEWPHLYPATDVTIHVGESFELSYIDKDGDFTDIYWYSDEDWIADVDGDEVTGYSTGTTTIRGEYDGKEITCIVRVIS